MPKDYLPRYLLSQLKRNKVIWYDHPYHIKLIRPRLEYLFQFCELCNQLRLYHPRGVCMYSPTKYKTRGWPVLISGSRRARSPLAINEVRTQRLVIPSSTFATCVDYKTEHELLQEINRGRYREI